MYRINRLTRPTLITVDEVITKAVVEENADIRFLMNSIEVAEERFIAPLLGDNFYEDFINQKNVVVTDANHGTLVTAINTSLASIGANPIAGTDLINGMMVNAIELVTDANYINLWNRFLWKITAECVDYLSTVPSWTRSTAQGQQQNNPKTLAGTIGDSGTANQKDIAFKMDKALQDRIGPLIDRMKKWMCNPTNQNQIALYDYSYCFCNDGINANGKGGIILGAYDQKDRGRGHQINGWRNGEYDIPIY